MIQIIESAMQNPAVVKVFKGPSGWAGNYPRYYKGEGWGFASVEGQQLDPFIQIANANFINLNKSGPKLGIRYGRFETFVKASHFVKAPKEGDKILILNQESSLKSGKLAMVATDWLPMSEAEKVINALKTAPRFRIRMEVQSTDGTKKERIILEGNNEEFLLSQFRKESKKSGELSLVGKSIRTDILFEKLVDGHQWSKVPQYIM